MIYLPAEHLARLLLLLFDTSVFRRKDMIVGKASFKHSAHTHVYVFMKKFAAYRKCLGWLTYFPLCPTELLFANEKQPCFCLKRNMASERQAATLCSLPTPLGFFGWCFHPSFLFSLPSWDVAVAGAATNTTSRIACSWPFILCKPTAGVVGLHVWPDHWVSGQKSFLAVPAFLRKL